MKLLLSIFALLIGVTMVTLDAGAARLGGGGNFGRQSSGITRTAPMQRQAPPQAAPTPPTQQPGGMSRWLGPLAGLAAGIGLASLFGNSGMGAAMGSIMMLVMLAGAAFLLFRLLSRGAAPRPDYYAPAGRMPPQPVPQPAPFTGNTGGNIGGNAAPGSLAATAGGASTYTATPAQPWPADFNAAEFERQAVLNFNRLQAANDSGDISTLRDFLTPTLYGELEAEMKSAWGSPQKTEPVDVRAQVVEVTTENDLYVVNVRFSGQIRENGVLNPLNEIWYLEKPVNGRSGWRVAGIQQVS